MKKSEYLVELKNLLTSGDLPKSLLERITYTVNAYEKDPKAVDVPTLVELKTDIDKATAEPKPVENSEKPKAKVKPKAKAKAEPEAPVAEEPATEQPKPKAKPKAKVKETAEKPSIKSGSESKASQLPEYARFFPETLTDAQLGTLKRRDDLANYNDFKKAVESGETILIAMYWNKRMLKKYQYSEQYRVPSVKDFPNDLDIVTPVMFLEKVNRVLTVSAYTDAIIPIESADFQYLEDTDGDNTYRVRLSYSVEFELYTVSK